MPRTEKLKCLPIALLLGSCTFGEGPELVLPESESEAINLEVGTEPNGLIVSANPSQPQNMTTDSSDAPNTIDLPPEPIATNPGNEITSGDAGGIEQSNSNQNASPDNIARIPRTDSANAPKINGDIVDYIAGTELLDGEWRFSAQSDGAGEPFGINNYMFGNSNQIQPDSHHHWAAMHDGEYLYLLVISDDAGLHFQDTNELRKPWKDDSVEIFIDGNHSRLTEYDGVDDFHITINLFSSQGVANDSNGSNPMVSQSAQSASIPSDLTYITGPRKGPESLGSDRGRKDIYKIRIKLSELNIELDMPFGFEVQLNDDDDGGTRDTKWAWRHPIGEDTSNDRTWQNPSFMGTAVLLR